jgi:sec-independent protein translocase protein TatC
MILERLEARTELKKPLVEHLEELLVRLRRSLFWVMAGSGGGYACSGWAVRMLQRPLLERLPEGGKIIFTAPFEKVWVYMRISFCLGLFFCLPMLAWEISQFVAPALKPREKRRVAYFTLIFLVVFGAGIYLGYLYSLPAVINAALHFGSSFEQPFLTLSTYINVSLGVLLFTSLMMEIPVLMSHLSAWGWVEPSVWVKGRKLSIIVNAIVSAFLSPPDALSMVLMMVPLQVLYESGIWGARMAQWLFDAKRDSIPENTSSDKI